MRKIGRMIGDGVDVEEDGAGNMAGAIFALRIAAFVRHEECAVDDGEIGLAQMRGEPFRRDKIIRTAHRQPSQDVQMKSGLIVCGRSSQAGTGRFFSRRKAGL